MKLPKSNLLLTGSGNIAYFNNETSNKFFRILLTRNQIIQS